MKELVKKEKRYLNDCDEYYEGINGDKRVQCCLDDYCVMYIIRKGRKKTIRSFTNDEKELCFKLATRALNK